MNCRKAASRSGGISISDSPLSTIASDSSTPEPPAPVMITTLSPWGVGSTGSARAYSSMSFSPGALITPACRRMSSYTASSPASAPVCEPAALRARRRTAGLEDHDRLLRHGRARRLHEGAAVLEVLQVHRDALGVRVLAEPGQQVVLVEVRLVAEPDDRRDTGLRGPGEAEDRHADATGLRGERHRRP